jgi:hypothetical protein
MSRSSSEKSAPRVVDAANGATVSARSSSTDMTCRPGGNSGGKQGFPAAITRPSCHTSLERPYGRYRFAAQV